MKCPKCRVGEMENVVFEGIEVDRCPGCGGMWFDAGEAETLKQFTNAAEIDTGDGLAGLKYDSIENVDCPRGHGRMATVVIPPARRHIDQYPRGWDLTMTGSIGITTATSSQARNLGQKTQSFCTLRGKSSIRVS